ncbi:hypothetical protein [Agromyces sp. Soil535]|uniref:hypothetical protein n=1 Tax=Agromyces sp. Soil535 TaxID=1736390 RepID=UPI0006F92E61|nr:hypothetical protein [Agromyces sp. Soil535]KRE31476.1 hypothetical protein ASG80_03310 [Agromyces sp. Soil535]
MEPLEIVRLVLLITHFVGLAAIIGAWILQMPRRSGFDFSPVLVGSIVQLVTGIALIAVNELGGNDIDTGKAITKLTITLAVLGLGIAGIVRGRRLRRRGASDAALRPLLWAAGIAAVANVVVAVVWR